MIFTVLLVNNSLNGSSLVKNIIHNYSVFDKKIKCKAKKKLLCKKKDFLIDRFSDIHIICFRTVVNYLKGLFS